MKLEQNPDRELFEIYIQRATCKDLNLTWICLVYLIFFDANNPNQKPNKQCSDMVYSNTKNVQLNYNQFFCMIFNKYVYSNTNLPKNTSIIFVQSISNMTFRGTILIAIPELASYVYILQREGLMSPSPQPPLQTRN